MDKQSLSKRWRRELWVGLRMCERFGLPMRVLILTLGQGMAFIARRRWEKKTPESVTLCQLEVEVIV